MCTAQITQTSPGHHQKQAWDVVSGLVGLLCSLACFATACQPSWFHNKLHPPILLQIEDLVGCIVEKAATATAATAGSLKVSNE